MSPYAFIVNKVCRTLNVGWEYIKSGAGWEGQRSLALLGIVGHAW